MISVSISLIHQSNPANSYQNVIGNSLYTSVPIPYDNGSDELKHVQKIFVHRVSKLPFLRDGNYNKYINAKHRMKRMKITSIYLLSKDPQITIQLISLQWFH